MSLPLKIFSGSSYPGLAEEVARLLHVGPGRMELKRFACNEIFAKVLEPVRGCDVYLLQTCTEKVNDDFMEMFIMIDALKRSFAKNVHVVIPHFGYARQDRVATPREPISAKVMAKLIAAAGADHVITICLHSDQEQGFFDFPVDNLKTYNLFADYFLKKKLEKPVVVAPDVGAAKMAKRFADLLGAELAILHKVRPEHNLSEVTAVVGDVVDKTCIIFDDLIDTAGTVINGRDALIKRGANPQVYLAATHAVFSPPASVRLKNAGFKEIVVSNTIPVDENKHFDGLTALSIAPLLAKTIRNVNRAKSVTSSI